MRVKWVELEWGMAMWCDRGDGGGGAKRKKDEEDILVLLGGSRCL
jgi:hypothetical protein